MQYIAVHCISYTECMVERGKDSLKKYIMKKFHTQKITSENFCGEREERERQ